MDDNDREHSRLDHVRDFCANTTAHGLARVAVAKSWPARLFWIVIITFASTICVVQIGRSVQAYFEYRTKTDIFLVNKEQYRFPAVTICNINPFKRSKIETTPIMNGLVSIILYVFYSRLPITRTLANSNLALTRTKINFPWISVIHLL